MKTDYDAEVIISGAGPVGLCLALLLARQGIEVIVFEKAEGLSEDLRASTFHPPTLDMLDRIGLAAPLVDGGIVCPQWQIRLHPDGDRAVFDLGVLEHDTAFPFRLQCEQWRLSRALLAALAHEPRATLRFAHEVETFAQDSNGVTTQVRDAAAEPIVAHSRLLVGADGAHSAIRRSMGLSFDGQTYPETTLLATTRFPFEEHLEGLSNVTYCWAGERNFSLLRVPGRWRVSIYPREDLSIEQQTTPEAIEESLQEIVRTTAPYEVAEVRSYRVHQRIVSSYVASRVALVGDAAHLNAPSGGMGLNGGLHDACDLAPAIHDTLRGGQRLERLALYDQRRRPVARDQILAQADANRARMRKRSAKERREILDDLKAIASDRGRLHAYLLRTSMIEGLRAQDLRADA